MKGKNFVNETQVQPAKAFEDDEIIYLVSHEGIFACRYMFEMKDGKSVIVQQLSNHTMINIFLENYFKAERTIEAAQHKYLELMEKQFAVLRENMKEVDGTSITNIYGLYYRKQFPFFNDKVRIDE